MRARLASIAVATLLSLAGCGEKPGGAPAGAPSASGHGAKVDLGRVSIAGHDFAVTRFGDLVPGKEGAFEVSLLKAPAGVDLANLNVYAWVEEPGGEKVSTPTKGMVERGILHFHVTPHADAAAPKRIVLRLRTQSGLDERGSLPLDGHGHEHVSTPHDGVVAAFKGPDGATAGHLELKLHDDKGDLEMWIAKDAKISQPFDLPLDATARVAFVDVKDKTVELRVRNKDKNEDEDGTGNVRDGKTNYFIFPGDTGVDATWLQGKKFQSLVRVTFTADGRTYTSEEFVLVPHTHADGSTHD